ncbi:hypothetical protein ACU639_25985 [Streptomyces cynarae]|uniref:hypothetical protein n=1 Tax=Streptomyces cynarae TaxID=2981134 RepID=UPI00406D1BFB
MTQIVKGPLPDRLADIKRRLATLAAERPSYRYQWTGRLVDAAPVAELEAFLGTPLPEMVALFLTEIGLGVGPFGGLMTPEKIRYEVQLDRDDCAADGIEAPDSAAPFPITARDVADEQVAVRPYPLDGAVRICHRGCGRWTVLALTGELAGTVWYLDCDWSDQIEWRPAVYPEDSSPTNGPVPFLDWVEQWLDRQ